MRRPREANDRAVAKAVNTFGGLDTLVNCVGIFDFYKGITDIDADDLGAAFNEMFQTNVLGHLHSVKAAVPAAGGGAVIDRFDRVGIVLLSGPWRGALRIVEVRGARTDHHTGL